MLFFYTDLQQDAGMPRLSLLIPLLFLSGVSGYPKEAVVRDETIFRTEHIFRPVTGLSGAIAAADRTAAEAARAILEKGGNAVDAAVTTGFVLAVTYPRAGNIGGGGFMIIHIAESGENLALDFREVAPQAATEDMFLDQDGNADPKKSRDSPLAVGVPGSVAGLLAAHERFGSLPLDELMAPAIRLARDGMVVDQSFADDLARGILIGRLDSTARDQFTGDDGKPPQPGEKFRQPELADTLQRIADSGRDGFYTGPTARAIVNALREEGGIMTLKDLATYQPVWREPVQGQFRGHEIISMPPPSSGGIHLVQMLNLIENFPVSDWGLNSTRYIHTVSEVMKRAYADRSKYLGDPGFADIPREQLLSEDYEQAVLARLDPDSPTPSRTIQPGLDGAFAEPDQTTHFSIVDKDGNAVSCTTTLNFSFGCGIMAKGAGFFLNNEMDDFSAKPGVPNAYGLIGGEFNKVEPGKRMLSSMTPTIVLKDGRVRIVTGSPGGSRIINSVLQVVLNLIEFDLNAAEAVNSPRFHHQWLPDKLQLERGFPPEVLKALRAMGYDLEITYTIGSAQTVVHDAEGNLSAAGDPRRNGSTAVAF